MNFFNAYKLPKTSKLFTAVSTSAFLIAATLSCIPATYAEESRAGESSAPDAKTSEAKTLEGLLQQVKQFQQQETEVNKQREVKFKQNKQNQTVLLNQAKKELTLEQKIADDLKANFDKNEKALTQKEDQLRLRGRFRQAFASERTAEH